MNPTLAGYLDAIRHGRLSIAAARTAIESWPGYRPGEWAEKAQALEILAEIEIERLRTALKTRSHPPKPPE